MELFDNELFEPALFNAIHALELGVKAALLTKVDNNLILHQVGGLFGREFRDTVGNEVCREINDILSKYNLPRYPGTEEITKEDAESTVGFVQEFIEDILLKIIKKR
jgi:HEPN domain-containing protein